MERISLAEYGESMADAGKLMQLIPLRFFYGINRIGEYEQSLIDAAYSVNVYIYGMNLIAEYDKSMTDVVYSVVIITE